MISLGRRCSRSKRGTNPFIPRIRILLHVKSQNSVLPLQVKQRRVLPDRFPSSFMPLLSGAVMPVCWTSCTRLYRIFSYTFMASSTLSFRLLSRHAAAAAPSSIAWARPLNRRRQERMRRIPIQYNTAPRRRKSLKRISEDKLIIKQVVLGRGLDQLSYSGHPPVQHPQHIVRFARELPAFLLNVPYTVRCNSPRCAFTRGPKVAFCSIRAPTSGS